MRHLGVFVLSAFMFVACGGGSSPTSPGTTPPPSSQLPPPTSGGSLTTQAMLSGLEAYIATQLLEMQQVLPANPHIAAFIQAKIDLLLRPTLPSEVRDGRLWTEGAFISISGADVSVSAVFPVEAMRSGAAEGIRLIEAAGPAIERFLSASFPHSSVRIWYGFKVGNSGGGGVIYTEDKGSYESRPGDKMPYDAAFAHELSHSYMGHESLTQFLEVYGYNVGRGASPDPATWSYQRNCVADQASSEGVCALLDVYRLIGHDAMSIAYRAVRQLRPPYGQPLSAQSRQAFVDAAPESAKAAVAAKMAKVIY